MMYKLKVKSKSFPRKPKYKKLLGTSSIHFSQAELCWAALTVGRPNKLVVKRFDGWEHEIRFRWNLVQMALRKTARGELEFSDLFNALDPTEKGAITYFLGMVFMKLCADKLLDIPWLVHYGWLKQKNSVAKLQGQSTPDMLGFSDQNSRWSVFEAKGTNSGFSAQKLREAKEQADHVISVNNNLCDLHIGGLLHRQGSALPICYTWEDPDDGKEEPVKLISTAETWRQYYSLAWALFKRQQESELSALKVRGFDQGIVVSIHPETQKFLEKIFEGNVDGSKLIPKSIGLKTENSELWQRDGLLFKTSSETLLSTSED